MKRVMIHVDLSLVITVELVIQRVNATINPSVDTAMKAGWESSVMKGNLIPVAIIIVPSVHSASLKGSLTNVFVMEEKKVCILCQCFFSLPLEYPV